MEFAITLDNSSPVPLHRQLYDEVRHSILNGRLSAGSRLPSSRTLAASLGVSRSTVTQSYDQLVSEGYLQTVVGSGTIVSEHLPDDLLIASAAKSGRTPALSREEKAHFSRLSIYGASLADVAPLDVVEVQRSINFSIGVPALDHFPMKIWRRLLLRHCRDSPAKLLGYAIGSRGERVLREAISVYLARSRAVRCDPGQVLIVNGSQQAIDLVTRLLINYGETVAIENPGYLGARRAFLAQGAKLVPVPVDESGMVIEKLPSLLTKNVKLIYLTPSHQFPTGAVLSLSRRLELIARTAGTGALIIEDDYDSEYRYCSRPIPALQGLDENENVIYIGTFSKMLFPSLRVGYLVVPSSLSRVFARARWLADRQSPTLEQLVLADFINEGHLDRHLRRMRALYDRRRQALVHSLQQYFTDRVTIMGENTGMHLMVKLSTRFTTDKVIERAGEAGIGIAAAEIYYLKGARPGEFVLGYANMSEQKIQEGVRRLAKALK
ncbi:MAG: PLP-dependent aminotransferase family protein [Acidobacteria bacterium]|nr:PLP-dependent aminotransferase family protein [Acidobacteriota bacterium]